MHGSFAAGWDACIRVLSEEAEKGSNRSYSKDRESFVAFAVGWKMGRLLSSTELVKNFHLAMSKPGAPALAANVETFDAPLRLLLAIAARAAAASRLPADASVSADDISIVEDLSAFHIEEEKSSHPEEPDESIASQDDVEAAGPVEVDANEVKQQHAKAMAAAQAPKISPEEMKRERERQRKTLQVVESQNSQESTKRKKAAREWADEIARHCRLGTQRAHSDYPLPLLTLQVQKTPQSCHRILELQMLSQQSRIYPLRSTQTSCTMS